MKIVDSVVYLFSFFQLYGQFGHFIYKLSGTLSYFYNEIFGEAKNEESFELEVFRAEAQNLVTQLEKIDRNSESVGCLLLFALFAAAKLALKKSFMMLQSMTAITKHSTVGDMRGNVDHGTSQKTVNTMLMGVSNI